jgi:hypothetical protein
MAIGVFDAGSGRIQLARAGLEAPLAVTADGQLHEWSVAGPFLGTGESNYETRTSLLLPGDRLVLATDGVRPNQDPRPSSTNPLGQAVAHQLHLKGQSFADAIANEILPEVNHEDDFTLLVLEA